MLTTCSMFLFPVWFRTGWTQSEPQGTLTFPSTLRGRRPKKPYFSKILRDGYTELMPFLPAFVHVCPALEATSY